MILLCLLGCEKMDFDFLSEKDDEIDEINYLETNQTQLDILESLAISGDMDKQYALGYQYLKGIDVVRDYKQAAKWFALAGEQGHAKAQ